MRIKGDKIVNLALDNKITREEEFVRKKSIAVKSQKIFKDSMFMNCVGGELPTFPDNRWDKEKAKMIDEIKVTIKAAAREENKIEQTEHLHTLVKQG